MNGSTEPTVTILRTIGFQVFHAHNGALEMMLEIGLAGFLLYLLVLVSTIVHGARVLRVEAEHRAAHARLLHGWW